MKPTAQNHPSIPAPKTAVIFDLDGTLLDTLADLANAMNAALAQLGFPPHTPDDCRHFVGDGASRFAERALPPETPLKPDPADALQTAALLACPPERIFFIGDTRTDMLTARAAGMIPIGALWGFRSADELLATGAQHLIEHPADFLPLLKPDL